jgi:CheY-like chemotaxis protein
VLDIPTNHWVVSPIGTPISERIVLDHGTDQQSGTDGRTASLSPTNNRVRAPWNRSRELSRRSSSVLTDRDIKSGGALRPDRASTGADTDTSSHLKRASEPTDTQHHDAPWAPPSEADLDVLVVDDDGPLRSTWAEILRGSGYSVAVAEDGDAALRFLERQTVGVVLLDLRMPRRDGLSVLEALTAPQLVVLVSAYSLDEATRARVEAKVVTYLEKPVPPQRLLRTVASTLGRSLVEDS